MISSTLAAFRAVFFDLDGVIIDSLMDITSAVNAALAKQGFPPLGSKKVQSFVGHGSRYLLARAFAESSDAAGQPEFESGSLRFDAIYDWYVSYYRTNSVEKTMLYPGIKTLLKELSGYGIHLAVISNKPRSITLSILEKFGIGHYFTSVVGPEQITKIKPAPEGLFFALKEILRVQAERGKLPIQPGEVLMVGDSDTDIQAGKAFGCKTCAVTGGYGDTTLLLAQNADITVRLAGELYRR
jgi:phosphoglycolate phosphatase